MKAIIRENQWTGRFMKAGWGNGYVLIPEGHPLHGKFYDLIDVDVHGGLTFSEEVNQSMLDNWTLDHEEDLNAEDLGKWCVGFDTCHHSDNISKWPKEAVREETNRLRDQLMSYIGYSTPEEVVITTPSEVRFLYYACKKEDEGRSPIGAADTLEGLYELVDDYMGATDKYEHQAKRIGFSAYHSKHPSDFEGEINYDVEYHEVTQREIVQVFIMDYLKK